MNQRYVARPFGVTAVQWTGDRPSMANALRTKGIEVLDVAPTQSGWGRMASFEGDTVALVIGRRVMRLTMGDFLVFADSGACLVIQDEHFKLWFQEA